MKVQRITLEDIAALAGVTKMTVSRYLRTPEKVKPETAERIASVIEEVGYQPDADNPAISSNVAPRIGVLVPSFNNQIFSDVLAGIESVTTAHGYQTLVVNYDYDSQREEEQIATVLALIPIVGIAVFGWFWFRGETYMAAWNVSGLGTFGAIQSTLNVTLWSFIGVESASVAAGVVKNPKRNVPIATIGGVLIAAVCYVLSTTAIMGMIPNAALRVSASPFGDAARMALGDTAGAIVSFCAAAGCLGSLGGWTLLAGQTAKAAADDGLFPPIFARVNKAGTPVAGLIIVGILMTIFQLSSISPNATKEFGLVSSVSVIFTLVPYLYTCAALLLLGHGHFGKARPAYLAVTTIAFLYCIWAVVGSGAKEVMWSFVTLMVITAMYALNYNRLHKNPYPLDAPISKD